jgi:hypothetical protein
MGAADEFPAKERVRPPAVAGSWYPGDTTALGRYLDRLLAAAKPVEGSGKIRALIAPHAGYMYSGASAAEVYRALQGASYRRVLVLGPSHHSPFYGLSIADVDAYETPLGRIPFDRGTVATLRKSDLVIADPYAHRQEHSIEMQLPLLQRALAPGWQLVPVLVGGLMEEDYARAADLLRPLVDDTTLVVVSSDFTHYGPRFAYQPFPLDEAIADQLERLDKGALAPILAKDAEGFLTYQQETGITVCGYRPIELLLRILPRTAMGKLQTYTTSGALTGDYGNSVSYMGVLFRDGEGAAAGAPAARPGEASAATPASRGSKEGAKEGDHPDALSKGQTAVAGHLSQPQLLLLHALASQAVETAVQGDDPTAEERLRTLIRQVPAELERPSGAFVTLKEQGALRGCIGYILPIKPLHQTVVENGMNAALRDFRFLPVRPEELPKLEVEVSVLSPPRPIASYQAFQVGEEGIILDKDGRSAVFLPEVATEQGWDREQTLDHLARKAGLPEDAWRQGASFRVFRSQKYAAPIASGRPDRELP